MFIKSIKIENFQCYAGHNNLFEFTEGLNVIIGDNATGKSKLYDAFNWVIFDECFETETRKFKKTVELRGKIVSDKAKFEAGIDEDVTTRVTITFSKNTKGGAEDLIVVRSYTIRKLGGNDWVEPLISQVEIFKNDYINPIRKVEEDLEVVLARVLPPNIRPYTWFQGEQVDSLIDFENKKALTDAINVLSDISTYDDILKTADRFFETVKTEYQREVKRLSRDKNEYTDLVEDMSTTEKMIENCKVELDEAYKNHQSSKERSDILLSSLGHAQEIAKINNERNELNNRFEQKSKELDMLLLSLNKSIFTKKWILRGVQSQIDAFEEKMAQYDKKRAEVNAQASVMDNIQKKLTERLPKGTPEPLYLKNMLEQETCLVCNRKAERESDAWRSIKELLDNASKDIAVVGPKKTNFFHPIFKDLYSNALALNKSDEFIDNDIQEYIDTIKNLKHELKELKNELKNIDQKINIKTEATAIDTESSSRIIEDFKVFRDKADLYYKVKVQKESDLERLNRRFDELKEQSNKLTRGNISEILETKKLESELLKIIATSTRERVFEKLINKLEDEANEHFAAMTKDNKGAKGRIKIVNRDGYYIPKNIDTFGNELSNINDSDIILTKIAVILAIISAKSNSRSTQVYTLITDAPSSKFTDNYTIGFCNRVAEVYNQSIIMSKDFFINNELRDRLLNGRDVKSVGNVYLITPSIPENARFDRNLLSTNIEKIK